MTPILRLTAILIVICGLCVAITYAIKAQGKNPAIAFGFHQEGGMWCWHNICPGKTKMEQAIAVLKPERSLLVDDLYPEKMMCWKTGSNPAWGSCATTEKVDEPLDWLSLDIPQPSLTLGDLVSVFGSPLQQRLCGFVYNNAYSLSATLKFPGEITVIAGESSPTGWRISPSMAVYRVSFSEYSTLHMQPWRGFGDAARHLSQCGT